MKKTVTKIIASVMCAMVLVSSLPLSVIAGAVKASEPYELADDYIKVTVSGDNGGFLIETVEGDRLSKDDNNQNLLYPSEDYDTSYTSIRVTRKDGSVEDYIFGRNYGFLGMDSSGVAVSKVANTLEAVWSVKDITVKQTLGLLDEASSQHGMVSVNYEVSTTADDVANVKIRIMLDTSLGDSDSGYYQVPNVVNEYSSLTNEYLLDNTDSYTAYNGAFFAVDDPSSPKMSAYTLDVAVDGQMMKPYQVAFGHWNSLAATVFDFVPDASVNFTTPYNVKYRTADSAYALYYDLGAVTPQNNSRVSTYYGVFSNSTVSADESVAINLSSIPASMRLTENEDGYESQVENGRDGDVRLQLMVENLTEKDMSSMTLVVKTMNNVTPYHDWQFNEKYEDSSDYTEVRYDFVAGEQMVYDIYFSVTPLPASEYRRFEIVCYDTSDGKELTEANLLGSREFYLFCPGVLGEVVVFNTISPQIIHYEGTRRLFISGQNIGLLQDTTAYTTVLSSTMGDKDVIVPSQNVAVDTTNNSMYLTIDTEMEPGAYQVVFDWNEAGKEDTTAAALQFMVSDKPEYVAPTYGIVTIEKDAGFDEEPRYKVGMYETEEDYASAVADPNNTVFLEFRGNFGANYDDNGQLIELKAVSMADARGKITNTINISNCLDVEDGFVSIVIENPSMDDQCINIDIDGRVYTTNARSTVWNGVCAITPFENGELSSLMQYKQDGTEADNIDSVTANTNAIMLLWPGAASEAQTLAGMIFELRYCYFGMIATEPGTVTSSTQRKRVVSFGAQLSPDFLLPRNFDWGSRQTSPMEAVQLKMAKTNYTADQLRDVETRYARDQKNWRASQKGSLNIYVDNILFGGGFVGFVTSIEVELPSYAEGLPGIGGVLDLHILPANDYWKIGVSGVADFVMLKLEAALTLKKAHGQIPGLDKLYLYVEGDTPGINVDGMGIFWIQGLGGGIDNLYDTICMVSDVPPISLLLSGKFALFAVLSARADLELSLRGFEVDISELGVKGITLIDNLGLEVRWYPALFLRGDIAVSILGIIEGGGYIVLEESLEDGSIFWEAFATAGLMIPDYIPLIGGYEVGRASLGVNCNKVWGAMAIIGIDFGVTYYWGGEVDFALGKYDAPEPTYPMFKAMPVAYDQQTGQTLYMAVGTNATLLADTSGSATSGEFSVESSIDRMSHTVSLGGYSSASDTMLTVTYHAETRAEAEAIAKNTVNITAVDDDSVKYSLNWLDPGKYAEEQTEANAIFTYDETRKEATVTVSFTEEAAYAHEWKVTTGASAELALYEMDRMASVDSVSYTYAQNSGEMKVDWSGYALSDIDTLTVYAVNEDGSSYSLAQTDNAEAGTLTFDIPEDLPSGRYTVQVIATSEANNISCSVNADEAFSYTNPTQPETPTVNGILLGGDYSIDADVTAGKNTDGYVITIEEKSMESGSVQWVSTELGSQWVEKPEGNGKITVGGQYETTVYLDADGNTVSYAEAQGRDDVTSSKRIVGLEAGKTYRLKIVAYNNEGSELFSSAVYSPEINMIAPLKPSVTVSVAGEKLVDGMSYTGSTKVSVDIASDMSVSGTWSLDGGVESGSFTANNKTTLVLGDRPDTEGLAEGQHTLSLTGTNVNGDSFAVDHVFCVKSTAPRLQISTPASGGFFGDTVTVAGLSEPGAKLYVLLDGEVISEETVDTSGAFKIEASMDKSRFEQTVSVYAEDAVGNVSRRYDFVLINSIVTDPDSRIAIFLDGKDYTNGTIPAGAAGTLELRIALGDDSVTVPSSSLLGSQAEWSVETVSGNASISGSQLTTDGSVNGMIKVSFENHDIAAVLGGSSADRISATDLEISIGDIVWDRLINNPETNTYFNEKQSVKITASNTEVGIREVFYYVSPTPLSVNVLEMLPEDSWQTYNGAIELSEDKELVLYAKAIDNNGDVTYGSTVIIVLKSAISVMGLEDGKTYFGSVTATVDDPYLDYVKLDGINVELLDGKFTISADGKQHTVTVADKAGNTATYTITVKCINHIGGEATCTEKAKCTVCGEEYGEIKAHTGGEATCTAKAKCTACGAEYGALAEHQYSEATCTEKATCKVCGDEKGETLSHTGGVATCTAKAKCTACGAEYGELAEHQYSEATCTKKATCKVCGDEKGETLAHTGGYATCTERAKCKVCGTEYGALAEHTFSKATCTKKATCLDCGIVRGALAEHQYSEATCTKKATCKVCGDEKGEPLAHTGGEATCTEKAKCEACGAEYGELAEHQYSEATCTEKATCKVCGDEKGEPLAHTGGEATCTAKAKCAACGIEYGELIAHADSDNDGKCDACDYQMTEPVTPDDPSDKNEGLGTGTVVAIAAAATVIIAAGGFAIYWFVFRKKKNQ